MFWRITYPAAQGDYAFTFLNGTASHPNAMPGVICDVCGQTWAAWRYVGTPAPSVLKRRKLDGFPLRLEQFDALRSEAEREIGDPSLRLMPGDRFAPAIVSVPSVPRADFLWASLGSLIVSARLHDWFLQTCGDSIRTAEVQFAKIGKREAHLPPPIPASGEPEDLVDEAPPLIDRSTVGRYYEIVPRTESDWPPGAAPTFRCESCLRTEFDQEARRLLMTPEMWRGAPIFYLATTLYILITDDLKRSLLQQRPTNLAFERA